MQILAGLEGGYSVEFARLGFETLGIEAREENILWDTLKKEKYRIEALQIFEHLTGTNTYLEQRLNQKITEY